MENEMIRKMTLKQYRAIETNYKQNLKQYKYRLNKLTITDKWFLEYYKKYGKEEKQALYLKLKIDCKNENPKIIRRFKMRIVCICKDCF
jgi:hypothetical protein